MSSKIFFVSLGCSKNLVDSENVLGCLQAGGYEFTTDVAKATIVIINTCSFIQEAVEESIDTILEIARLKEKGLLEKLIVLGCLTQRYGYKLRHEIPEVDVWLGTGELHRVVNVLKTGDHGNQGRFFIGRPLFLADHNTPRLQTTPFHTAYLKIAEGCSHRCSFCIIPAIRGPFRSRTVESVVIEAEAMVARGVKEIVLVAQDVTMYGRDLYVQACLEDLLERLLMVTGIKWIRLMYCYPDGLSERLLELIDSEEIVCPYLDIPFQHASNAILEKMGRRSSLQSQLRLVEMIRRRSRRISLRTTLMVGFPGETETAFNELCDFVKTVQFDHLGVFVFSKEPGTAAARFDPVVDRDLAEQRKNDIILLQADISEKINQQMIGQIAPVLIEGQSEETELLLKGRTAAMAPDIDGQVLINKGEGVAGKIMPVLIKEAYAYDLIGEIK